MNGFCDETAQSASPCAVCLHRVLTCLWAVNIRIWLLSNHASYCWNWQHHVPLFLFKAFLASGFRVTSCAPHKLTWLARWDVSCILWINFTCPSGKEGPQKVFGKGESPFEDCASRYLAKLLPKLVERETCSLPKKKKSLQFDSIWLISS